MNKRIQLIGIMVFAIVVLAGCQITVNDLTPFEFRTVQVASNQPDPTPPDPVPPDPTPPVAPKEVVYFLGIDGVD